MKPTISSHYSNDDWRLWEFTRDSKLPMGYFDQRISPDSIVVLLTVVVAVLTVAGVWWTEGGL